MAVQIVLCGTPTQGLTIPSRDANLRTNLPWRVMMSLLRFLRRTPAQCLAIIRGDAEQRTHLPFSGRMSLLILQCSASAQGLSFIGNNTVLRTALLLFLPASNGRVDLTTAYWLSVGAYDANVAHRVNDLSGCCPSLVLANFGIGASWEAARERCAFRAVTALKTVGAAKLACF